MELSEEARALLEEILEHLCETEPPSFPPIHKFRVDHESQRALIDELQANQLLAPEQDRYVLTIAGLLACRSDRARFTVETCDALLPIVQAAYREQPAKMWTSSEIAERSELSPSDVARALVFLVQRGGIGGYAQDGATALISGVRFNESVLDVEPIGWSANVAEEHDAEGADERTPTIDSIEITGYRPFRDFSARPGDLTVIIGANASGKSSLFDFLRFVSYAASNPLPPEIDPRSVGRTLFHVGGPERIAFELVADLGQFKPLRYRVEIQGPIGDPRVVREKLATIEPLRPTEKTPFVFLDFAVGKGVVRDQVQRRLTRPQWTVQHNELALRRALDPTLVTLSKFQNFVSSWRFYSGFEVSDTAAIRRPVPTEPSPTLAENGSNLSAVLNSLRLEHGDTWNELETHMRSAIPGFQSLGVKPRGGPGTVIGFWREIGVRDELTLADLSDGTLRLLCLAALCLAPTIPPLVCIDEPELGFHPRVLPVVAGLLRLASTRSQILIATHSPYLLSQFTLDEIAVMRKEDGCAVFVRPGDSRALRREIEELGGEALSQFHISEELEVRS